MKFGNFLFPDSRDPERDGIIIDETLREAWLSDELGVDVIWLGEHHFDGICAYVDPISFAGALATSTRNAKIGFAVVQTALHHPIRLAEQLAILDNITKGRLIVGLGRGSSYNIYDYQGFGIDHREAQSRLEEVEEVIVKAWASEDFEHCGRYWNLKVPMLRPRPYTRPHPELIRAASGEASLVELARRDLAQSWVWRNVLVAESDAEAERVGVPAFAAMIESRAALRNRIYHETGVRIEVPAADLLSARGTVEHGFIHGSPARVADAVAEIAALGIGGIIASFRLGPVPHEAARNSLTLFMQHVAPEFRVAQ